MHRQCGRIEGGVDYCRHSLNVINTFKKVRSLFMQSYEHILLAVDYSQESSSLIEKAQVMVERFQAKLSVIHVIDAIPMPDTSYGTVIDVNQEVDDPLLAAEQMKFKELCQQLQINPAEQWLVWGIPATEIINVAKHVQADVVLIGYRHHHGLAALFGNNAAEVMRHVQCDVWTVTLR